MQKLFATPPFILQAYKLVLSGGIIHCLVSLIFAKGSLNPFSYAFTYLLDSQLLIVTKAVICSFLNSVIFTACDCSSPLQEIGRAVGVALMKQCGWRADLRDPDLEIFVHLNDIHTVVGIPLFRLPLANREYIKTAGLRSTVAWAMASLAEISVSECSWQTRRVLNEEEVTAPQSWKL
uniref:Uncharacterized protein n=1 Tax=Calidris pygmaea TaxID=425635 RepID=A0A8C3J0Q5_9CHAR